MTTAPFSTFLRRLARGMVAETLDDQSDRQLVEQLLARHDDAVFTALVRRHGPMVYRVCWRVLQQEQDTEDAFQATFLLLAQKLPTVRKHDSLASWLHGVAHRVALKARAQAARRRRHEEQAGVAQPVPPDGVIWNELRAALDAELAQLPDKWRLPLILCYLEGRTQDQAAGHLGWRRTTLQRRLAEARAALGRRLGRRGFAGPAALSAVLLSAGVAPAALAPGLIGSTVDAAARVAAGHAAISAVSVEVAALTEGVLKTMLPGKLKIAMALLLAVAALSGVAGLLYRTQGAEAQEPPKQKSEPTENAAAGKLKTPEQRLETDDEPINHIWITQKNVQEDLRLTKAQVERIQKIRQEAYKKYEAELKKARARARKGDFAASREIARKLQDEERKAFAEEAPKILSAGAIKRLQQIQRQARGLHNLIQEPAVKKKLDLNDEQLRQIETFLKEGTAKARAALARRLSDPGYGPLRIEDHIAAEREAYADTMKKVVAVLTREQQRTWNKLVGEPFAFKAAASK